MSGISGITRRSTPCTAEDSRSKRRFRSASFYVEWAEDEDPAAVLRVLRRMGAQVWEVDGDVDLEYAPSPRIKRAHTVFRFRLPPTGRVWELLSAVAEHPSVYSVSEMRTLSGLFRRG